MQDNKHKPKAKDPIEMIIDKVAEKVIETTKVEFKSIFNSLNSIIEKRTGKKETKIEKEPNFKRETYTKKSEEEKRFENAKDITPKNPKNKMRRRI